MIVSEFILFAIVAIYAIWLLQAAISTLFLINIGARSPKSAIETFIMTFLPYVLWCVLFNKNKLL